MSQNARACRPRLLPRGRILLPALLGASVVAFLSFWYRYMDVLTRGGDRPFLVPLVEEVTGVFGAFLLFVPVVWLTRRWRWRGIPWERQLGLHVLGLAAFAFLHTTLLWGSRSALFPLLGLGSYDYGHLPLRYLMELGIQIPIYLLCVAAVLVAEHLRASRARALRVAELERELVRSRLQNLESQLRPHFLFNALNTVSSVMFEDTGRADRLLSDLGRLLRRSLRASETQEVALSDELKELDLFLAIARARFEDRLDFRVEVDPELGTAAVPALLLQPLVENALEHGDPGEGRVAEIRISGAAEDGRLVLRVRDNGPGADLPRADGPGADLADAGLPREASSGRGIGLGHTRRRLALLYPDAHEFEAGNRPEGGFEVKLAIPLRRLPAAAPQPRSSRESGPGAPATSRSVPAEDDAEAAAWTAS